MRFLISNTWFGVLISTLVYCQGNVLDLNSESFQEEVQNGNDIWLVEFYHKEVQDVMTTLSEKLSLFGIRTGSVDCENKANKKLCQSSFIQSFPGLRLYIDSPQMNPYTNKNFRNPIPYSGPMDSRSLEKFVSKPYSTSVLKISSYEEYEALTTNSSGNVAMLFSEKDTVSMLYKSIAFSFRSMIPSKVSFVQVSKESSSLTEKFGIDDFPSFIITSSNGTVVNRFEGDLKDRKQMLDWCSSLIMTEGVTSASSSIDGNKGTNNVRQTQEFIESMPKNILLTTGPTFKADVLDKQSFAWIVIVNEYDSEGRVETVQKHLSSAIKLISRKAEGAVQSAMVFCSSPKDANSSMTIGDLSLEDFGEGLCQASDMPVTRPYLLVIPHGESSGRKKMQKSMSKWTFNISDPETAVKRAGESLPETGVARISEAALNDFINFGVARKILSILLISDKDQERASPTLLRNLGLMVGPTSSGSGSKTEAEVEAGLGLGIAQIGLMNNPSEAFLKSLGPNELPLPALVGFFVSGLDNDEEPKQGEAKINMIVYDANRIGPIRLSSARQFVLQAHASSGLPLPDHETSEASSNKKTKTSKDQRGDAEDSDGGSVEEEVPPPPSEPDPEAEAFLEEIKREEEERAAQRKQELEEEAKARAEEIKRIQAEKTKKTKKKKGKKKAAASNSNDAEL
eukprot:gene1514-2914_t